MGWQLAEMSGLSGILHGQADHPDVTANQLLFFGKKKFFGMVLCSC